jgi:glutaredoxin
MATMLLRALMICLLASMCNAFGLALSRSSTHSRASILRMSESGPNPVLGIASLGMGLIKPIFKAEAALQATVLSLGSEDVREEARAQIETDRSSAPVVVYTYGLSPFSTECKAFLDKVGCKYEAIELGPEWFLLGPKASAMRAELAATTGQSSLPHVFIQGKSVGGLYSANDVGEGLSALQKSGELATMLKAAGAL